MTSKKKPVKKKPVKKKKIVAKKAVKKKAVKKKAVGRPSDYHPVYCIDLVEHMEVGLSYETFAAKIDVIPQTLYNWEKRFPEFLDAKKRGQIKSQLFWEELGIKGASGYILHFNTGAWVFNMKNRFKWRDVKSLDVTGKVKDDLEAVKKISPAEAIQIAEKARDYLANNAVIDVTPEDS